MEKPITIKDIAKKLGLSTSTVSRALSDSWEIKKETKELVIKTAAELNYHPNTQAKGLVTKKSYTIGIVVPELVIFFSYDYIRNTKNTNARGLSDPHYSIQRIR